MDTPRGPTLGQGPVATGMARAMKGRQPHPPAIRPAPVWAAVGPDTVCPDWATGVYDWAPPLPGMSFPQNSFPLLGYGTYLPFTNCT
jgi:hypothetical protein